MHHKSDLAPIVLRGPYASSTLPFTSRSHYPNRSGRPGSFSGTMSQSSFFTRHNPHPYRVRHIKGLLDAPICHVSDSGFESQSHRQVLQTPERRRILSTNRAKTLAPIYPTNSYGIETYDTHYQSAVPYSKVPHLPNWYQSFKELMNKSALNANQSENKHAAHSKATGRLNEPTSRLTSRGYTSDKRRHTAAGKQTAAIFCAAQQENEALMFDFLSQILRIESIPELQHWLVTSTDREKDLVLDMINAGLALDKEKDLKEIQEEPFEFQQQSDIPAHFDRLTLDEHETDRLPEINKTGRNSNLNTGNKLKQDNGLTIINEDEVQE